MLLMTSSRTSSIMAEKKKMADLLLIGSSWTSSIMAEKNFKMADLLRFTSIN